VGDGPVTPTLHLYDDTTARGWQPFALTRPAGELLLGAHTMRGRAELLFGTRCGGHISSPHLHGFGEPGAVPAVELSDVATAPPRIFLSSRAIIDWGALPQLIAAAATLRIGDDIVGCIVPAGEPNPPRTWFDRPQRRGDDIAVAGRVLEHVWDLVSENPRQLRRDLEAAAGRGAGRSGELPVGVHVIGGAAADIRLGANVTIEPGTVLDVSEGGIWLDDNVAVRAFTRLAGPAFVGAGSTLLGGPYTTVSIGPGCKVHGEIEESVVLGYANKAHDGFLGHAYLGRWVNLGAMTTNSDLKNNYGSIRMWTPEGETDTGLMKLGCLLGDHVKTGIGALLNTGTVIGAGSNIYGSEMPPKYVPPFSWGSGAELVAFDEEKFISLAATVMGRRKLDLSADMQRVLRAAWRLGRESAD
jgi:UDP-N-acetylglucosamine diphosphorylase / glucose-1-phosphate thymidylyltransferase / UDP-N-acetylgalactosamine diphosphorylase / glucosamine-1-phosphate N-acetyltransferase / galactosamine-1-phosphate N-acetyltransferase